jgi:hypothetical protein
VEINLRYAFSYFSFNPPSMTLVCTILTCFYPPPVSEGNGQLRDSSVLCWAVSWHKDVRKSEYTMLVVEIPRTISWNPGASKLRR